MTRVGTFLAQGYVIGCLSLLCNHVLNSVYVDVLYAITSHTEHNRETVGNEFISRWQLYTRTRLPTTHMYYQQQSFVLLSVFAHISDYTPVCHVSHTSCYIEPFLFSCINANNSSEWTSCRISHTPWSGWQFLLCCLITSSSSEWTICCISHTPSSGCPFLLFHLIANS